MIHTSTGVHYIKWRLPISAVSETSFWPHTSHSAKFSSIFNLARKLMNKYLLQKWSILPWKYQMLFEFGFQKYNLFHQMNLIKTAYQTLLNYDENEALYQAILADRDNLFSTIIILPTASLMSLYKKTTYAGTNIFCESLGNGSISPSIQYSMNRNEYILKILSILTTVALSPWWQTFCVLTRQIRLVYCSLCWR